VGPAMPCSACPSVAPAIGNVGRRPAGFPVWPVARSHRETPAGGLPPAAYPNLFLDFIFHKRPIFQIAAQTACLSTSGLSLRLNRILCPRTPHAPIGVPRQPLIKRNHSSSSALERLINSGSPLGGGFPHYPPVFSRLKRFSAR